MAILAICIFCCCYNEPLADNRWGSIHPGLNSVCSCTFKAVLLLLRKFIVSVHSGVSLCTHSMRVWILIFEMTLITKKEGGKNCTSWPKAIKGTLISSAIMLWGILNSVISACYIWRKVSGNCFVLLEPPKKRETFERSSRDSLDHLAVRFPAICTQSPSPSLGAHAWLSDVFSQALISVKKSVSWGQKKIVAPAPRWFGCHI